MSRYDIVVFGFTGFTEKFTFAVCGRNSDKIHNFLSESAQY